MNERSGRSFGKQVTLDLELEEDFTRERMAWGAAGGAQTEGEV